MLIYNSFKNRIYTNLFIHKYIDIPITFDYWHHTFCTGDLSEQEAFFMARETWDMHGVTQCTHYSESRRQEKKLLIEKMFDHHNISLDTIHEWPTFEKEYKNFIRLNPDLVVVVAYGQIIPDIYLENPDLIFLNLHV